MGLNVGDVVVLNYTVSVVEEGVERVVDTTDENVARSTGIYDPNKRYGGVVVVYGRSSLLEAVEETLASMSVGERREIIAPPEKAYGPRREDLVVRVPVKQLQRLNIRPRVGEEVEVGGRRGVITRVTERFAYIDLNHPLAGKTLKIVLELVSKAETPADKARLLASRHLGLDPSSVDASYDEAEKMVTVKLPAGILGLLDLEARLRAIAADIYDAIKPKRLVYTIEVEYPEEFKREETEATPQTQEGASQELNREQ